MGMYSQYSTYDRIRTKKKKEIRNTRVDLYRSMIRVCAKSEFFDQLAQCFDVVIEVLRRHLYGRESDSRGEKEGKKQSCIRTCHKRTTVGVTKSLSHGVKGDVN